MNQKINELVNALTDELRKIESLDEKVEVLNYVRESISKESPFSKEPVDCVLWVKAEAVHANHYNPNKVAPPEMKPFTYFCRHRCLYDASGFL